MMENGIDGTELHDDILKFSIDQVIIIEGIMAGWICG